MPEPNLLPLLRRLGHRLRRGVGARSAWQRLVAVAGLAGAVLLVLQVALAASITVDTTSDVVDGNTASIAALTSNKGADGRISLREAVTAANNDAGSGPHTITLGAGTFPLSAGQITITAGLTIQGAGAGSTTVSGGSGSRIFNITGSAGVTLRALRLTAGTATNSSGGAISNSNGALTLRDCTFDENDAGNNGGAVLHGGGNLVVENCSFVGNYAFNNGGALHVAGSGTLTLTDATFTDNSAANGDGGAVHSSGGAVAVTGSSFSTNEAGDDGAALFYEGGSTVSFTNTNAAGNSAFGSGAVLAAGTSTSRVTVSGGRFDSNSAVNSHGGVLEVQAGSLSITGAEFTGNSSGSAGGAVYFAGSGDVEVGSSRFATNQAAGAGGAINALSNTRSLAITGGSFEGNSSVNSNGGAIQQLGGTLSLNGTPLTSNTAGGNGGGVYYVGGSAVTFTSVAADGNQAFTAGGHLWVQTDSLLTLTGGSWRNGVAVNSHGGGVFMRGNGPATLSNTVFSGNTAGGSGGAVRFSAVGLLTFTGSTVSGNSAFTSGGGLDQTSGSLSLERSTFNGNSTTNSNGGAILLASGTGSAALSNLTLNANTAGGAGGGVWSAASTTTLTNVTVAGNTATSAGGLRRNGGTFSVRNTIVAANGGGNCAGTITTLGNNLDSANTCGFSAGSDLRNSDPLLSALADNGGSTQTMALGTGSPAINAGTTTSAPSTDQRGEARVGATDIGAFEFGVATAPALTLPLYLTSSGVPSATLSTSAPTATTLANFDSGRDSAAGLLLSKGGSGAGESDSTKYQRWLSGTGGITLSGTVQLHLWSAMKDFDRNKAGSLTAYLRQCNGTGGACTTFANATLTRDPWSAGSSTWVERIISFGTVSRTIPAGSTLEVKVIAGDASDDDMMLAYATISYPSRLAGATAPYSISGTVYEDRHYGGGAGRSLSASGGSVISGARVELYDGSGAFVSSASTTSGTYSFTGLSAGSYHVRVASQTVASTRTGTSGALRGVMTYRTTATSGTAVAVTDHVGGTNPAAADPGSGAAGTTLNTSTYAFSAGLSGTAHAVAPVTVGSADVGGVDFGFNFTTVVNVNDSGQGSLRQALTNANTLGGDSGLATSGRSAGIEHLVFMIGNGSSAAGLRSSINLFSGGVATVEPRSALPSVSAALVLDARTQPGWNGTPVVELNGTSAGSTSDGLNITGGGSLVAGFAVNRFGDDGISVVGGRGSTVIANHVGTDPTGTVARPNGHDGVAVEGSADNIVGGTDPSERNVMSGNANNGLILAGTGATGNRVLGNYIGVDASGNVALKNGSLGLYVDGADNIIGGTDSGAGNVISANQWVNLFLLSSASGTVVQGNVIGLDADGSAGLSGSAVGVYVQSAGNLIGGPDAGARNVISGNPRDGVQFDGTRATDNRVMGNLIGRDAADKTDVGNGGHGVALLNGAASNQIGGTGKLEGNAIRGNKANGVSVEGKGTLGNSVLGNQIAGNGQDGIDLGNDGPSPNDDALDTGQPNTGMDWPVFTQATLRGGTLDVAGYVGTGNGAPDLADARVEVFVADRTGGGPGQGLTYLGFLTTDGKGYFSGQITGVSGITIGSTEVTATATDKAGNTGEFGKNAVVTGATISGSVFEDRNYGGGPGRSRAASSGTAVVGARVELYDASGAFVTSTTSAGDGSYSFTDLDTGSYHVRVASQTVQSGRTGSTSALRGVLTYRTHAGSGTAAAVTDFVGGTNPALADPGSGSAGTAFDTSTYVFTAGQSGTAHAVAPVTVSAGDVTGVDFGFNFGTVVNANDQGQGSLRQALTNANTLGGDSSLAVSGRTAAIEHLVFMIGNGTTGGGGRLNLPAGGLRTSLDYRVGGSITISVASTLPSVSAAVVIDAQAQPGWVSTPVVRIDGDSAPSLASGLSLGTTGCTVRGLSITRFHGGIVVWGGGSHVIAGNHVGIDAAGTTAAGNRDSGIYVGGNAGSNTIGGSTAADRNVISGNVKSGIYLHTGVTGTAVRGNHIGTNAAGTAAVPNNTGNHAAYGGITIDGGATTTIGGSDPLWRNVISGNNHSGVNKKGSGSGNTVAGNYIGTNAAGSAALPNSVQGVLVEGSGVTVGGTTAAAGNVITGSGSSTSYGVRVSSAGSATVRYNRIGTNAAGSAALDAPSYGIALATATNAVVRDNLVSGNGVGIWIAGGSGHQLYGNLIGTNAAGTGAIGNTGTAGLWITDAASNNTIGGTGADEPNTIAFNTTGVRLAAGASAAPQRQRLSANRIYGNSALGIDLTAGTYPSDVAGVNANDGSTTSGQPNLAMDHPVLTSASVSGSTLTVAGHVGSAAGQSAFAGARVEVFTSDNDGTGHGEGSTYLGYVTADGSGNFSGSFTLPGGVTLTAGTTRLTATATDANGNTSEFGPNLAFGQTISGTVFEDVNYGGGPGRNRTAAAGVGRGGVTVELIDRFGALQATTTTATDGSYAFTGLAASDYLVRVVTATVTSSRSGATAGLLPVQTYRYEGSWRGPGAVTDEVGGMDPAAADSLAGAASYGWTTCADENSTCSFTGTRVVRYGANTAWTTHVLTGGTACSNAVFNDPVVGVRKACQLMATGPQSVASASVRTGSLGGVDFGYNFNTVVNVNDGGRGSLRQALTNANTLGGDAALAVAGRSSAMEHIVFMLPNGSTGAGGSLGLAAGGLRSALNVFAGGVATIAPATALPTVTAPLAIDAQTQPGWTAAPVVALDLQSAGSITAGLWVSASNSTVRGLAIGRTSGNGLLIGMGATRISNVTVQGNRIGVDAGGTVARANTAFGLRLILVGTCTIGGTATSQRNVVSGNGSSGIGIEDTTDCTLLGNFIGVDATGEAALANAGHGVQIWDSSVRTTIGGAASGAGNVISGNTLDGINSGDDTLVLLAMGNRIGASASGNVALGNGRDGVRLQYERESRIGGTAAGEGNQIAHNVGIGVNVRGANSQRIAILGNRMHDNGGLGIDLGGNGPTANNGAKSGSVSNAGMDTPVFTAAAPGSGTVTVAGYVGAAANDSDFAGARVEVFVADDDASGFGEGRTYLGALTADASGNFSGTITLPDGVTLTAGVTMLTATATDALGNTSEFSARYDVGQSIAGTVYEDVNYGGGAGRDRATALAAGGRGLAGATVELYTAAGTLEATTTTAADGSYRFDGVGGGHHFVRVVTGTLRSSRTGSAAGQWPVQTWRYEASWQSPAAVTDEVGGARPATADSGAAPALTWTQCALENTGDCVLDGTRLVRYGEGTAWTVRVATDRVDCANGAFGDPAPNAYKSCEVLGTPLHSASSASTAGGSVTGLDFGYHFGTVVNTNDSGQGSLRQAMLNANALGGDSALAVAGRTAGIEHVVFMIPNGSSAGGLRSSVDLFSGDVATVAVQTPLPAISAPLVLDARTQPGWAGTPRVQLDGQLDDAAGSGLQLQANNVSVHGFLINRFNGFGIFSTGNTGGHVIQGNYIGADATGRQDRGNAVTGIRLDNSVGSVIGGSTAGQGNVVVGGRGQGILVNGGSGNIIRGNLVGVGADGSTPLPNATAGVVVDAAAGVTIGGTGPGEGNVIAHNGSHGVVVIDSSAGVSILGNRIYGQGGLGIDLGNNGVTPNDGATTAGQPNGLMDHPVLASARARGDQLTVAGHVGIAPGQGAFAGSRIELFVSDGDASGHGEGRVYLGALTADGSGRFSGTLTMAVDRLALGTVLTATATSSSGNTSEFGAQFDDLVIDFVVNTTADDADASIGDGDCLTAAGFCSLRAALAELNAWTTLPATPTVAFALPGCAAAGATACSIAPGTALPAVARAMVIDGQTQPGWSQAPLVELDGRGAPSFASGLAIDAAGTTVRGLAIGGFGQNGIRIAANDAVIEGNHIGVRADGSTARANGGWGGVTTGSGGIYLTSGSGVVIGGTTASQRNLLSGNGGAGVWVHGGSAVIIGNRIGTDAAGMVAVGNGRWGVHVNGGTGTRVGGAAGGEGNLVSGNRGYQTGGIFLAGSDHVVQGNTIGQNVDATAALPNGDGDSEYASGIDVRTGSGHLVGGTGAGEGNLIAGNQGHGVRVSADAVRILGNRMSGNLWLGIDLGADGLSANDGVLASGQPNGGMDHPVLGAAGLAASGTSLAVYGAIGTGSGQAAFAGSRVEVFKVAADASGYGEGAEFLGALTADANGRFSGTLVVAAGQVAVGDVLTATATDPAGRTSEFGPNLAAVAESALAPGRFDAFDTDTPAGALSGVLTTRVAGSAGSVAVVAIDAAGTALQTGFEGTVTLEWMDARDNTGALDAGNCRASWVSAGNAGSAVFTTGSGGRSTAAITPAAAGREWRLRIRYAGPAGTVTACSGDALAVRPDRLQITGVSDGDAATAGTTRALDTVADNGGRVHRAGRPFSLRAAAYDAGGAVATGYDGTPGLALTRCLLPASGCIPGTLTAPALVASAGLVAADTLSYSEVGAIELQLTDDDFAAVDAADTPLAQRRLQSAAVGVGRFVPDSYGLTLARGGVLRTVQGACAAPGAGFTYFGQAFGWATAPQVTVTARNAAGGTTVNWTGNLMKLTAAGHATDVLTATATPAVALGSALAARTLTDGGNGTARIDVATDDVFALGRDAVPRISTVPVFGWTLALADDSEAAVAGNPTLGASLAQAGVPFDSGGTFHTGRLRLNGAHGDMRVGVRALVELQRYTAAGWTRLSEDNGCLLLPAASFSYRDGSGRFAGSGNQCAAPLAADVALVGGRGWLVLPKSPGNLPGALTLQLNLGTAAAPTGCSPAGAEQAATALGLPHLRGAWNGATALDGDPSAVLTWGVARREFVLRRERTN